MKISKKKNVHGVKKQKLSLREGKSKVKKKFIKDKIKKSGKSKLKKTQYGKMSVDEFMADEELSNDGKHDDLSSMEINVNESKNKDDESDLDSEQDLNFDELKSHKQSLSKLKDTDPDFYKFLEENDKKLLNFNVSDSEDEEKSADEDENEGEFHKPSDELEVASDEDDFEPEGALPGDGRTITLQLLKKWQTDIQTDKSSKTLSCLAKAFNAALLRVSSNDADDIGEYRVDGSAVFNAVIQLCVLEIGPAFRRYLRLPPGSKQPPHKCKKFVKIKNLLKGYFMDLLKLLGGVTSSNIQNVLLKHLHGMAFLIVPYTKVTQKILRRLVHMWGTGEESVRVIAFLCILRITNNQQASYLDLVLRSMYMTYVNNSKFMSVSTIAEINFMRRSLVEIFALDLNVSYQRVFLFVRQLAIHLRSAMTLLKQEHMQGVLNWQFVNSLHLWAALLSATCNKPHLQPLLYPLVQITIGLIKLKPSAQYFPLRFHCLEILIGLSRDMNIFIPILPLLLEVLTLYDFSKKHKKVSMKPIDFTCVLRVSKSQMEENGFKDALINNFYDLLLEYLASQSHSIAFPDLTLMCTMQIKQFVKKCKIPNYTKKLRQMLDKIQQNNVFIESERKNLNCAITDVKQINAWETNVKNKGTPLTIFNDSWKQLNTAKKRKQITKNDSIGDYNLPVIRKGQKPRDVKRSEGPVELFPSDSEDDETNEMAVEKPVKVVRQKRGKKKHKIFEKVSKEVANDVSDIVEDIKASDW